jgi:rRNA maturation RNase YbeY
MSELVLRNRQRVRAVDLRQLRRLTRSLIEESLGLREYELGLHLVAASGMTRLNEQFLQHTGSTDVITFDHSAEFPANPAAPRGEYGRPRPNVGRASRLPSSGADACPAGLAGFRAGGTPALRSQRRPDAGLVLHGEIFVCLEDAVAQARQFGVTWQDELARYVVHGLLHLLGHDDLDSAARRRMKREENRLVRELAGRFRLSQLSRRPRT